MNLFNPPKELATDVGDAFADIGKPLPSLADQVFGQSELLTTAPDVQFHTPGHRAPAFINRFRDGFNPSEFQKPIFMEIEQGTGHIVIIAVAGSGKSTTELRGLAYTDPRKSVAMVSFNSAIAKANQLKAPKHVKCKTLHQIGLGLTMRALPNTKLMVEEGEEKMDFVYLEVSEGMNKSLKYVVKRLVGLCKAMLVDPTEANLDAICDQYNIDVLEAQKHIVYELTEKCFKRSIQLNPQMVDFNDVIHTIATGMLPVRNKFDVLLVDETQDLDPAQIEFILAIGERLICVGDPNQSIYAFRGADSEAMPNLIKRLNPKIMPLSICYRCPKSSIRLAQKLVPQIQWRPDAPEGILEETKDFPEIQYGDLILSRTNAPLVRRCLALIRARKKASIRGKDLAKGIVSFIENGVKTCDTDNLTVVLPFLEKYTQAEAARLMGLERISRAEYLLDQFNTLVALSDSCATVQDVKTNIRSVFADNPNDPIKLSSVHGAKGLEADRVIIDHAENLPMVRPKQTAREWQQELNVEYVAYTRNKNALYLVREEK